YLLDRKLAADGAVCPRRLWAWLEPYEGSIGYDRKSRSRLYHFFQSHDGLRREVQRYVLLDAPEGGTIEQRRVQLGWKLGALVPSEDDVISLFHSLEPANRHDESWREILLLCEHDGQ